MHARDGEWVVPVAALFSLMLYALLLQVIDWQRATLLAMLGAFVFAFVLAFIRRLVSDFVFTIYKKGRTHS